ncbi:MAG: bifunctional adenosylcobinamide kinase/adenosylcobinamide-phosphate guanylyltransferase [Prochlorococcaceae cyanobacterium]
MVVEAGSLTLVCGPSRGGKSRWAEHLADRSPLRVHYLATAADHPNDPSWQARIALHRQRRPQEWILHSPGPALAESLEQFGPSDLLLVDALGTWLALHLALDAASWQQCQMHFLTALQSCQAAVILVAEETGWGVVPATAIGGLFRDRMGALLDRLHRCCDASWLVLHGRAINLLALSEPVPEA